MDTRQFAASFLSLALVLPGAVIPAAAANSADPRMSIGVAGAVQGMVRAVPASAPTSIGRVIQSGKPLYVKEHVTTGPGGHLQIMLKDETIFTIGPNSDIVLDEFVYNPETEAGKVSASVTKGVFRFITGNIGHKDPSSMEVKLPAGTIGIRGTIVAGQVNANGTSMAVLLGPGPAAMGARVGAFQLSNSAGSVFVGKPGFGSTLGGAGVAPTPAAQIPAAQLKALLSDLAPTTVAMEGPERGGSTKDGSARGGSGKGQNDDNDNHGMLGDARSSKDGGDGSVAYAGDLQDYKSSQEALAGFSDVRTSVGADIIGGIRNTGPVPALWEDVRQQIVSGTGYYPGRTGSFNATSCNSTSCSAASGSWGFSDLTVDFGAKTITGSANISTPGGAVAAISDTLGINVGFASLSGNAAFGGVGSSGYSDYKFQLVNEKEDVARTVVGNAGYDDGAGTRGVGEQLVSTRVDGTSAGGGQ